MIKPIRLIGIYLLLFCLPCLGIDAEDDKEKWIQKGRIFYEFALSQEKVINPSESSSESSKNYFRYLVSEDKNTNLFGLSGILDSQKQIDYSGNNQKLSLEYLLNSWLGIGGSLQNSVIYTYHLTHNNTELSKSKYDDLRFFSGFIPEMSELIDFTNAYGLLPDKKDVKHLRTYDYDLTFHLPATDHFDPYFRISAGRGFMTEDLIGRTGWSSGFKWKLGSRYFLNSDVFQSRLISKSKDGEVDQFLETGIRIGAGFYSTWP